MDRVLGVGWPLQGGDPGGDTGGSEAWTPCVTAELVPGRGSVPEESEVNKQPVCLALSEGQGLGRG